MGKRGPAGAAAPKQKAAKAAAKAAAAAVPAAGSPEALALALPLQQPSSVNAQALALNGKIWATHLENVRVFKEQAVSEDLVQMKPLDRSFAQVFDENAALESLKRDGKYMCLINLLWLDQTWSPTPQIPINKGAVEQIKTHWFAQPCGMESQQVTVGILKQEMDSKTFPASGTWKRLSAEESILAFFEAASAEAAKVAEGASDLLLQQWLNHCLTCPVLIRVVSDVNEMEWAAQQLREDMTQLSFLQRTPTQRIFDVMQKRDSMGVSYTPESLIQLYSSKIHLSAKSEKITKGPLKKHCLNL